MAYHPSLDIIMAFLMMQVKTGFDEPICNYILPFLCKSGKVSVIYHKYGKSFIEIISLSASCTIRGNTLKSFSDLNLNIFLIFLIK